MQDQIMQWLTVGNAALLGQNAIVTVILAMTGGYGVGQIVKFPLKMWLPEMWANWIIRQSARLGCFLFGAWLGGCPLAIVAVAAMFQPAAYTLLMKVIRKYVPWLAATPVGSASPTEDDQEALTVWRTKGKP